MTEQQVEARLKLHILNICLAAVTCREDDLRLCRHRLVSEVTKMLRERKE